MRCDEKLRFTAPADNSRPYGSHRFDTFCIKVGRRATVFGDLCLSALIRLEIDPSVLAYCERPMVLEDLKPKRVVDFWVKRTSGEELWFLLRPSEKAWPTGTGGPGKAFSTWASAQNLTSFAPVGISLSRTWHAEIGHIYFVTSMRTARTSTPV